MTTFVSPPRRLVPLLAALLAPGACVPSFDASVADPNRALHVELVAGSVFGALPVPGSVNGTVDVRFFSPTGLARDPNTGDVYVADTGNLELRRITRDGRVLTFSDLADSFGVRVTPGDVVWRSNGLLVNDAKSYELATVDRAGNLKRLDIKSTGIALGIGGQVFITSSNYLYVSSPNDDETWMNLRPHGPDDPGTDGLTWSLDHASTVAYNPAADELYVIDGASLRVLDLASRGLASVAGEAARPLGTARDPAGELTFDEPRGLVYDPSHDVLYVSDRATIRAVVPGRWTVVTVAGVPGDPTPPSPGPLPRTIPSPRGMVMEGDDLLVAVDHGIVRITSPHLLVPR